MYWFNNILTGPATIKDNKSFSTEQSHVWRYEKKKETRSQQDVPARQYLAQAEISQFLWQQAPVTTHHIKTFFLDNLEKESATWSS